MHHKWQLYEVWFRRYGAQQTEFLLIWIIFLPFYPPNNSENQKIPRDIIILHNFTENDIHMMYSSWDMERGRQNFLPFWTIFCPFISLTIQKIKNSKKWKSAWRYHHFTQVPQKPWSYAILSLKYGIFFFHTYSWTCLKNIFL